MSPFHTIEEGFAWIESHTNLEKNPSQLRSIRLERMRTMLEAFGNPERSMRTIHVAGSKGKGMVTAFAAAILAEAGYRVGRYMSPHVSHYKERIECYPQSPHYDEMLLEQMNHLWEYSENLRLPLSSAHLPHEKTPLTSSSHPTTFELLTTLAWLMFRAHRCDWAVIEVGIGGRLDATNVQHPCACVITHIEYEHTEYLGTTLPHIAAEKAGIIKPNIPICTIDHPPGIDAVIAARAAECGAPLTRLSDEIDPDVPYEVSPDGTYRFSLKSLPYEMAGSFAMHGPPALENGALALLAIHRALPAIDQHSAIRGLAAARLPARFEIIGDTPPIILDGAHTPHSIASILDIYRRRYPHAARRGTLIFGCLHDKNVAAMAAILGDWFEHIIITTPGTFRPSDLSAIAACFPSHKTCIIPDTSEALHAARQQMRARPDGSDRSNYPILITGSFYLAGLIRALLTEHRTIPYAK